MHRRARAPLALAGLAALAGCTEIFPPLFGSVAVHFHAATTQPAFAASSEPMPVPYGPLVLSDAAGELRIEELAVLVDRIRLEERPGACDAAEARPEEGCWPMAVPDGHVAIGTQWGGWLGQRRVGRGSYRALRFRVATAAQLPAGHPFAEHAAAVFPDWPAGAGVGISGTYRPRGGTARPFRVYLTGAEALALPINPALRVRGDEHHAVALGVDPAPWFAPGGVVADLSAHPAGALLTPPAGVEAAFWTHAYGLTWR